MSRALAPIRGGSTLSFKQHFLTATRYHASKGLAIGAFETRSRMSTTMHLHARVNKTLGQFKISFKKNAENKFGNFQH